MIVSQPINSTIDGLFQVKTHKEQKYAKFIHEGAISNLEDTYNHIFASWITDIQLEFVDQPILEFYVNHHEKIPQEKLITEIYIAVE